MSIEDNTQTPEVNMEDALQNETLTIEEAIPQSRETVGLPKYLEEKRLRKEREAEIEALRLENESLKSTNYGYEEDPVEDITRKYTDVSPELLRDIVATTKRELDRDYGTKIASFEAERQQETASKKFQELFARTIDDMPEYSQIVNPEIIKSLAFNPANAKKTMPQIIEETYGKAITGRKTLESTTAPRRGAGEIDFANMSEQDYETVRSDQSLKQKHEDYVSRNLRNFL